MHYLSSSFFFFFFFECVCVYIYIFLASGAPHLFTTQWYACFFGDVRWAVGWPSTVQATAAETSPLLDWRIWFILLSALNLSLHRSFFVPHLCFYQLEDIAIVLFLLFMFLGVSWLILKFDLIVIDPIWCDCYKVDFFPPFLVKIVLPAAMLVSCELPAGWVAYIAEQ